MKYIDKCACGESYSGPKPLPPGTLCPQCGNTTFRHSIRLNNNCSLSVLKDGKEVAEFRDVFVATEHFILVAEDRDRLEAENARLAALNAELMGAIERLVPQCRRCEGFGLVRGDEPMGDWRSHVRSSECPICTLARAALAKADKKEG